MTKKYRYTKHMLMPPQPRAVRDRYFKEIGLPSDPNQRYTDEIINELQSVMITLSALLNYDHPDHECYDSFDLNLEHYKLWDKIEDNLEQLIDDMIENNTPAPLEYDEDEYD